MTDNNVSNLIKVVQGMKNLPLAMMEVSATLSRANIILNNSTSKKEKFFAMQITEVLTSVLSDQLRLLKNPELDKIIEENPYL